MGRWTYKIDFKNGVIPSIMYIIITLLAIILRKFSSTELLNTNPYMVSGKLYQYYHLFTPVIISFISLYVFEENYRNGFISYVRTLPISVPKIFIYRYVIFIVSMTLIVGVGIYFSIAEANKSIAYLLSVRNVNHISFKIEFIPTLLSSMITINLCVLLTQGLMVLFKNKVLAIAIILGYSLMEYGPWGRFLADNPLIFGSMRPIAANVYIYSYQYLQLFISLLLFVMITIWHYKKYS